MGRGSGIATEIGNANGVTAVYRGLGLKAAEPCGLSRTTCKAILPTWFVIDRGSAVSRRNDIKPVIDLRSVAGNLELFGSLAPPVFRPNRIHRSSTSEFAICYLSLPRSGPPRLTPSLSPKSPPCEQALPATGLAFFASLSLAVS